MSRKKESGNLTEIMYDLIETGFDGLHCLDKNSNMNPIELQRLYGRKLCLWGGLTVEDLELAANDSEKAKLLIEINSLQSKGGFILGTNSGLFDAINIMKLRDLYKEISLNQTS